MSDGVDRDRHIRRNGDDYASAFLSLLPRGQAWPKYPGSTLERACTGLALYWGFVDSRAADLLEIESDPRTTTPEPDGLLPEWERAWGLPDPCYTEPQTVAERRLALLMRMTMLGAQSREFFIEVAAMLGYAITITEYRTFVVGMDRVGDNRVYGDGSDPMLDEWNRPIKDPNGNNVALGELSEWPYYGLGPPENRFYWTVHVSAKALEWFRCASSQCGVDPHLRIRTPEDLECLLNRWKPAHTEIIFDYTGITLTANAVSEGAAIGTVVGTLDIDPSIPYTGTPVFTLTDDADGKFAISGNNITVAAALDYETATSHTITVAVTGIDPPSSDARFIILVTDVAEA